MMEYIALSIPVFFILIGVEYVLSLIQRRALYRLNDSVNDLSMGIIDQVGGAFVNTLLFAGYLYVWKNWRVFDMGAANIWDWRGFPWWVWVSCFIAKDFMYYWAHRMSHEMNLGWATHIVHHQSEEFNLSVALRQGVFQGFFFWIFFIPLAFVGFPPTVYLVCSQFNTIYQFWIHTRTIGKLGFLEWFLNTPSHHRVHHGRDPKYIDRNHGGVLIIWDRLFGTFQEEEEEPNYGLVSPLRSWNPIWGQVHYFVKLAKLSYAAPYWTDKIRVWFAAPAWKPRGLEQGVPSQKLWEQGVLTKYDTHVPRVLKGYVFVHFVIATLLALGFMQAEADNLWLQRAVLAGLIFWSLLSFGGILELRKWVPLVESLRLIIGGTVVMLWGHALLGMPMLADVRVRAAMVAFCALSLLPILFYRKQFTNEGPECLPMPQEVA